MTRTTAIAAPSTRMAIWKALLLSLPMLLFASYKWLLALGPGGGDRLQVIAGVVVAIVFTTGFGLMLITGQTHRYRSALFILLAIALPFYFIPGMFENYGTNMLSDEMIYSGQASFCPLTMPMMLVPAALKRFVVFPGPVVGGVGWFIAWLGATLSIGRGWCSWGCFYGGWDELFSRVRKKPVVRKVDPKWLYLPFAVLLAIVLLSALTFTPIYCEWLCPFKTITEFAAPTSLLAVIQGVIFLGLFLGLVIVLPLLTKRRTQCALFCPFGAMQSLFNKINIFEVRIDKSKCSQCKLCLRTCPTLSLDEGSLDSGKPSMTCTKCGQCVDTCPKDAISYHIKGTPIGMRPNTARVLFIYPAFLLLSFIGVSIVSDGLWRILKWITTGSMI